ncbi:MAG: PD40 domain-containing protein [Kiritimatiellae bacterium]|nr:PD40 domain-containing protein [Kiritimatiellia bacterium]
MFLLALGLAALVAASGCIMRMMYADWPSEVAMEPEIVRLAGLNTEHDDYNVGLPPPSMGFDALLVFASNARSQGRTFGIETGRLRVRQDPYSPYEKKDMRRPVIQAERGGRFAFIPESPHNVRGPTGLFNAPRRPRPYPLVYSNLPPAEARRGTNDRTAKIVADFDSGGAGYVMVAEPLSWSEGGRPGDGDAWMFDLDEGGRRDLYFVGKDGKPRPFFGNLPEADDAYATYDFRRDELYFSSNRSGRWQLYRVKNRPRVQDFNQWLGDASRAADIEPAREFESDGNTMAPVVDGDWMFFASDRKGGYGQYDIYASKRGANGWERPVNLQKLMPRGVSLNTKANEFRPCALSLGIALEGNAGHRFDQRILVFSSDRPGGLGGYDLYLTALPEKTKD